MPAREFSFFFYSLLVLPSGLSKVFNHHQVTSTLEDLRKQQPFSVLGDAQAGDADGENAIDFRDRLFCFGRKTEEFDD